jgi:hypothetical protein
MATTNNITTTYIGKDSKQFISPILNAGKTIGGGGLTIKNNVNYRSRITKLALSGLVGAESCDWDATGTINQTELWLAVTNLEVNLEVCKSDYFNDFIGENSGNGDALQAQFLAYLIGEIGANVSDAIETMVWQGSGGAGTFAGINTLVSGGTYAVTGTTAPSATTIIAEVRKMTQSGVDLNVVSASDAFIYVSSSSFQALREAFNDKANANPCGENCMQVDGVQVFHAPGMVAGSMLLAQKSNLFFGTWANSDLTSIKVKDMSELLEDNIRFAMKFFAGVQVGYADETSYYPAA